VEEEAPPMSSRDDILRTIRAQPSRTVALPELNGDWIRYDDPFAQFARTLESVGGRCVRVATVDEVATTLATDPKFAEATRIASRVPYVHGSVQLDDIADPHELESLDWAVVSASFGVAENGAVWVTDSELKHRVALFIVQHLAIVLPSREIVPHMHAAYERITLGESSLGIFISGPSKTADIEQSLVIGAHGPRSLTMICVDSL
jgi:L-lactate dehydrogenase complex protein LldG